MLISFHIGARVPPSSETFRFFMKNYCRIVLIADASTSMSKVYNEALEGMRQFIKEQKQVDGAATFELVVFSSHGTTRVTVPTTDIQQIAEITEKDYVIGGLTALVEAVGVTIDRVGAELAALDESERPNKVIIAVMTDGEENNSEEYTFAQVAEKRKHQEEVYNWSFVMLANDLADAERIGVSNSIMAKGYGSSAEGTLESYRSISDAVRCLRA